MADFNAQDRRNIHIGDTVDIVLKKDQPTGKLTRGEVGRILTNSQQHHRGIKVMLTDGQVGRVQHIISASAEEWDLYSADRVIIGECRRGDAIPEGKYHLVVHVWLQNSRGQLLISQRAESRPTDPLMWECVGGSVLKGENSYQGAIREVMEEVGVDLRASNGIVVHRLIRPKLYDMVDVWLFHYDGNVDLQRASTDEVVQCRWMEAQDVLSMLDTGKMVRSLEYFADIIMRGGKDGTNTN